MPYLQSSEEAIPRIVCQLGEGSCVLMLREKNNIGDGFPLKKMGQHFNVSPIRGG